MTARLRLGTKRPVLPRFGSPSATAAKDPWRPRPRPRTGGRVVHPVRACLGCIPWHSRNQVEAWSWMSWRLSASKNHGTEVLRSTAHPQFHTRPTSCYQPCGWVRSCRVPTGVFVSYKDSALHCSTRILGVLSFHPLFGRFSSRVVMGHDIPAPQATGSKKNTPKSLIHKPPLLH